MPPSLTRLVRVPPQTSLGGILAAFLHLLGRRRGGERRTRSWVFSQYILLFKVGGAAKVSKLTTRHRCACGCCYACRCLFLISAGPTLPLTWPAHLNPLRMERDGKMAAPLRQPFLCPSGSRSGSLSGRTLTLSTCRSSGPPRMQVVIKRGNLKKSLQ